mgnify:CR=1 FL=1|jgi:hypothetical protein
MVDFMPYRDDEDAEIRISRRQWMDPDQKEKVMGRLKQMMMDPKPMSQELIIETFVKYPLIGFGEASFSDLESYLGHPDIHPDHFPNGLGISAGGTWKPDSTWDLRCAWGFIWDDGERVVLHDRNSQVKELEDLKYWHITGSRAAWYLLTEGYLFDPISVSLEKAK